MSISFKRNEIQIYIENAQNCFDVEKWSSYRQVFANWKIQEKDIIPLENCRDSDITSYFFKALESFLLAIKDLHSSKQSWSIVKLYYSLFYLIRCDILLSNYLLVRNGALFIIKLKEDEVFTPFKKKTQSDHKLSIAILKFLKEKGELADPILDNTIDQLDPYTWYMKHRERINYTQKCFVEPETDLCFSHLEQYFQNKKVIELFKFYNTKDYSICFDTDHSILSIPFKKLMQIIEKGRDKIDIDKANLKKIVFHLKELKTCGLSKSELLKLIVT
ncbi:MAG: hypothetical protein KF721_01320 [Ignavibacteriaceae bacterium]|nr:hypothetical protein [Ignavibacteriaceae bacterium]